MLPVLKLLQWSNLLLKSPKTSFLKTELQTSEISKLFLSPHLSLEDFQMQQRIVKVFKTFRTKEGDHYNFNIFPQGQLLKFYRKKLVISTPLILKYPQKIF